jgi:hypothetical protein
MSQPTMAGCVPFHHACNSRLTRELASGYGNDPTPKTYECLQCRYVGKAVKVEQAEAAE